MTHEITNERPLVDTIPGLAQLFEDYPDFVPRTELRCLFVPNLHAVKKGKISPEATPGKMPFNVAVADRYNKWLSQQDNPDLSRLKPGANGRIVFTHDEVKSFLQFMLDCDANGGHLRYVLRKIE